MKRLFAIAAAVLAVFFMSSCEKDGDSTTAASLVGTWEVSALETTYDGIPITISAEAAGINAGITFSENGSGYFYTYEYGDYEREPFSYTYSNGKLKFYSEYEDESITIPVTVKGNKMTMSLDENLTGEPGTTGKIYLVKK
jgi:hypothetical protein